MKFSKISKIFCTIALSAWPVAGTCQTNDGTWLPIKTIDTDNNSTNRLGPKNKTLKLYNNDSKTRAGFASHQFIKTEKDNDIISTDRSNSDADLQILRPSALPFDPSEYMAQCAAYLSIKNEKLSGTRNCQPKYRPYVASRQSADPISKIIGAYEYEKHGARHASRRYNNPVANGFHPIFTILPPINGITIVRVDDLEWSQDRDAMSGVYLSIKDGKVVALLSAGCSFDTSYICSSSNSEKRFQLQENGSFNILP